MTDLDEAPQDVQEYLEEAEEMLEQTAHLMLEAGMLIEEMESRQDIDDYLTDGETVTIELDRAHLLQVMSLVEDSISGMQHPVGFYSRMSAFRAIIEQQPDLMQEAMDEALEEHAKEQEKASRGFQ